MYIKHDKQAVWQPRLADDDEQSRKSNKMWLITRNGDGDILCQCLCASFFIFSLWVCVCGNCSALMCVFVSLSLSSSSSLILCVWLLVCSDISVIVFIACVSKHMAIDTFIHKIILSSLLFLGHFLFGSSSSSSSSSSSLSLNFVKCNEVIRGELEGEAKEIDGEIVKTGKMSTLQTFDMIKYEYIEILWIPFRHFAMRNISPSIFTAGCTMSQHSAQKFCNFYHSLSTEVLTTLFFHPAYIYVCFFLSFCYVRRHWAPEQSRASYCDWQCITLPSFSSFASQENTFN